jgi:hypothetical protein
LKAFEVMAAATLLAFKFFEKGFRPETAFKIIGHPCSM